MAGRYQLVDSDEYRLPEGMQRIGYDADTQTYTFRDEAGGSLWESEPGSRYGRLHPAGSTPGGEREEDYEEEMLRRAKREDWRYMAPFFLIILAILLLVWRFFGPSIVSTSPGTTCANGMDTYDIKQGDTCWDLAERAGISVEELREANEALDCERLRVGRTVCVPVGNEE